MQRGLRSLGYSEAVIEKILRDLESGKSLAESTAITKDHLPVFDSAVGARPISWQAQLGMVASVQPFISGSISKTLNLPESATPEIIARIYHEGWRLGLKSLAIYRDQSKAFQPLTSG